MFAGAVISRGRGRTRTGLSGAVLKSVLSLTEVERLMGHSRPGGQVQEKKSLISFLQQLSRRQSGGRNRICPSVCPLLISIVSKLAAEVLLQLNLKA